VRALRARTTGLLGEDINEAKLMEWEATCDNDMVPSKKYFALIAGDPGCRKSSTPQRILKNKAYHRTGNFSVILPTTTLCQDWKDKLDASAKDHNNRGMPGEMVSTFERAIAKYYTSTVIITDEDKFPKGYTALFHILNPTAKYHIMMCDPWQTEWHAPDKDCLLNSTDILGEAGYYMKYASMYLVGTWRLSVEIANFWQMPTFSKKDGAMAFTDVMPTQWSDLKKHFPWLNDATLLTLWEEKHTFYASHIDTIWATDLRGGENNSFAGSQGLSVPLSILEVDEKVLRGSDPRMIYTASTRAQYILYVRKWRFNGQNEMQEATHPVFRQLAYYRNRYENSGTRVRIEPEHTVNIRTIVAPFPESMQVVLCGPPQKVVNRNFVRRYHSEELWKHYIDPDATRVGARISREEEVYKDEAQFGVYINPLEEYEPEEYVAPEITITEPKLKTSIPITSREGFEEYYKEHAERFDAELSLRNQYSDQLPDTPQLRKDFIDKMKVMFDQTAGPNRKIRWQKVNKRLKDKDKALYYDPALQNWGLAQKASDDISFLAAIRQRIKWSTVRDNEHNLHYQKEFGGACWEAFKKYLHWEKPHKFDSDFYDKCEIAFQVRRGDRSEAEKKGSLNRADPDYGILMTAKTQWKLKDRQFSEAKPLQPIMIHSDKYLYEWGPKGIYLLEKILENTPDYWFFYAKKTPEEFAEWTKRSFVNPNEIFAMNDLKGQDQSVQGWAVEFFSLMMTWFGFPAEWVHAFVHDKTTKQIRDKVLAIMTDSGEIWTYLINTTSATARECLMFDMLPGDPMANGGDDTIRCRKIGITGNYERLQHLDPCIDKRFESNTGEFCSFITRNGILAKDPVILLKRFLGKISMGAAEDAVHGYAILWALNYGLGDRVYDIFNEHELEAHQIMNRIMFNLGKEGLSTRPVWENLNIRGDVSEAPKWELVTNETLMSRVMDVTIGSLAEASRNFYNAGNVNEIVAALG
jgi:hypothetical protein